MALRGATFSLAYVINEEIKSNNKKRSIIERTLNTDLLNPHRDMGVRLCSTQKYAELRSAYYLYR